MTLALELESQWAEGEAKGRAEGLAEGLAEGETRGEARGLAKGLVEGVAKGKLEMLKELVQKGMLTIKDAAGMLGLSEELFRKQAML